MKKPVFRKRFVRLYWDLQTSGRYQRACGYFSKAEKSQVCFA
jgi:hypothetical protein